ncbi:MAG TPA: cytochrome c biogenesis protein ResB [Anaerolineae bacterium]|nr:cytochrome c biogenesis protein ResB [Anaerolineae bacterium]
MVCHRGLRLRVFLIAGFSLLILDSKSFFISFKYHAAKLVTNLWYGLRSPRTTGLLIAILALVALLAFIIPQQSNVANSDTARAEWIASLPNWVQAWGDFLFFWGFSHLFRSLWFWLPLVLLLMNSLIALADYGPGSWQRLQKTTPNLQWQHPLAHRAEYLTRLPESPDDFFEKLKKSLEENNYWLYENIEADQRIISAARRRRAWLGPAIFYMGLLGLISALLMSYHFLQVDHFTLLPLEPQSNSLFEGQFELTSINSELGVNNVNYLANGTEQLPINLQWRLYQPTFFHKAIILPLAIEPTLKIEARDSSDTLLRLIPSQENLFPAERLHLSLDETNSPLYFLIPTAGLAFQILPDPANRDVFNVQVRRGSELSPSTEIKARAGQAFEVDNMAVTMSLNSNMTVMALRDPAWPLYLIGLILVATAGLLIFWQSPLQLWLIPEVKGRGGQLYSVVEKFGSAAEMPQFLDKLLKAEE